MNTSLSVLLPVHNAQAKLQRRVAEVLDVLPELTGSFDVLIIDDGSTDETPDVACDLAMQYPQVRVVRHPIRLGLSESVQTGLDHTDGDIVVVGDEQHGIRPADLRKLWSLRSNDNLNISRRPGDERGAVRMETMIALRSDQPPRFNVFRPGLQVRRRRSLEQLRSAAPGIRELTPRRLDRAAGSEPGSTQPDRPNFLAKIRRLTWGE